MPVAAEKARALLESLEARRQQIVDFACELIETPSINPPGDERQVAGLISRQAIDLGLGKPEVLAARPERPNLALRVRGGRPGPTFMLNGHMDTKPVGDRSEWHTDPLVPTILDGQLYGLGSSDMKAAVAAMLYAAATLAPVASGLAGDLLLVFTADEEYGSKHGAIWLAESGLLKADVGLLGEPSGITREWEALHVLGRGITAFRIKVYGTQMHSSCSDILPSVNAAVKMANVLARVPDDLHLQFPAHPLCPQGITVNPGVIVSGGVTWGVYPGYAEFATDVRTLPGMTREGVRRDLDAFLARRRAEDPELRVEWEFAEPPLGWIEPQEVSADDPLVKSTAWAAEQVLGFRPPLSTFPGATDATAFQHQAGIRCIPSFGPGLLPLAHGPNEHVAVESIVQAAKIYALAVADFLSGSPGAA